MDSVRLFNLIKCLNLSLIYAETRYGFNMIAATNHDYIQSYEQCVQQLEKMPKDQALQHQAVLALARAGCLDFAISEYKQYGLADIRHNEDVMALGARLLKDLYLRGSGKAALEHARDSAHRYEAAFKDTSGYYSGINSASMALMADMPTEIVEQRAKVIHDALPESNKLSSETRYFIEATRAESFLLLGQAEKAKQALRIAIEHDPLNYAAHATTLKQFRMILSKVGATADWLSEFRPPRSIHFAGHIFSGPDMSSNTSAQLSNESIESLSISIADILQKEDIGFGFGALAAGADILIAEGLLNEGAELHIVFPTNIETFIQHSVLPFGSSWKSRFDACLEHATSVNILTLSEKWPDPRLNRFAGQVAMGQAALRAGSLSASLGQLLLWNQDAKTSYTAIHANDWKQTRRAQTILPFPAYKAPRLKANLKMPKMYSFQFGNSTDAMSVECATTSVLAETILTALDEKQSNEFGVHMSLPDDNTDSVLSTLISKAQTNQILVSEVVASILAFANEPRFQLTYAGRVSISDDETMRAYNLHVES